MKLCKLTLILLFTIGSTLFTHAQCPLGQVEVTMDVTTDGYGYEGYWEIVPNGNSCGVATVASGGNTAVGCNGGGAQNQTPGGYGNNQTYNEGPWCLIDGASYDLIFVDDWGDGGFEFEIMVNGYNIGNFDALTGANLTFTFVASEPPSFDGSIYSMATPYLYDNVGLKDITGIFFNYGTDTITSMDLNYSIDNGPVQVAPLTGLNLQNFESYNYTHPTQWNATIGIHTVKIWASNLNGNMDQNNINDTIEKSVEIGPGIPNIIDNFVGNNTYNTVIGTSADLLDGPTDLDFHPALNKRQLWVINKRTENQGGSTVIYDDAGLTSQTDQQAIDGNAWHFMSLPTGMAFGKNGNWGSSPGVYDANHNGGQPFTGPTLWSGDLNIYAQPSGGNGSHLDMLHESPYAQGIANEKDNIYWVFDGNSSDIVMYDFVEDHGPGNSFHGDGIVHRYADFSVAKDPNDKVPSHLVVDSGWVYVVDYGNQKVFRIQIGSGTVGGTPTFGPFESLAEHSMVTGYNWEDVVTTGLIEPAGIDVIEDRMIVSDYSTGEVIIYDISTMPAVELDRINTGATGIMGVKIGPDGNIWYVDYDANTVNLLRVGVGIEDNEKALTFNLFPNPSSNQVTLNAPFNDKANVQLLDATGKQVFETTFNGNKLTMNTSILANGIYLVRLTTDNKTLTKKLIIQH